MKILMISDTHGNDLFITTLIAVAKQHDLVIHLGDDYQDAQLLIDHEVPVIRVPGTWTAEYQNSMIDNRRFDEFLGWRLFLTHTPSVDARDLPDDIDPKRVIQNEEADIFCHGHTHRPMISEDHGVTVLNPGHLTAFVDRGYRASFATLELSTTDCNISIIDFENGDVVDSKQFTKY